MKRFLTLFTLAAALYAQPTYAATLANWEFDGTTPSTTGAFVPVSPTDYGTGTQDANLQTAIITLSETADARTATSAIKYIGWEGDGDVADFAEAITDGHYYSFQFEAQTGYQMSLTGLDILLKNAGITAGAGVGGDAAGGADVAIYSSIGGFSVGNELLTYSIANNAVVTKSLDLTGGAFDNITSVEFRVYAKGSTAFSKSLYLGNGFANDGVNDLLLSGTISAVPEPSSYALIVLGAIALMSTVAYRRYTTAA